MTEARGTTPDPSETHPPVPTPPVPPYAAHLPGTGTPQQLYPGAPPTYPGAPGYAASEPGAPGYAPGTAAYGPGMPPMPPGGSSTLAVLALVLAVIGALIALIPFVGGVFGGLFLVAAIVLGIIALVRRAPGRGLAICALVVSGVGILVSVLWAVGIAAFGGWMSGSDAAYEEPPAYEDVEPYDEEDLYGDGSLPALAAPGLGVEGSTRADALAFGTSVVITDENIGDEVWTVAVGVPTVIDPATGNDLDEPPVNGAYVGVPIELTNMTDAVIDLDTQYDYSLFASLITGDGGRAEYAYLSDVVTGYNVGPIGPGETATYYEVFDVGPQATTTGTFVLDVDDQQVFWGPGL